MSCPISSCSFHPSGLGGVLLLLHRTGRPHEAPGHGLCYYKASLMGGGFLPSGFLSKASAVCAWALSEVQPDSSGNDEEVFGVLAPLSPAIKFLQFTLPTNPPRRPPDRRMRCLWSIPSDGGSHWEQMRWLGPCPDELTFPSVLGITSEGTG